MCSSPYGESGDDEGRTQRDKWGPVVFDFATCHMLHPFRSCYIHCYCSFRLRLLPYHHRRHRCSCNYHIREAHTETSITYGCPTIFLSFKFRPSTPRSRFPARVHVLRSAYLKRSCHACFLEHFAVGGCRGAEAGAAENRDTGRSPDPRWY